MKCKKCNHENKGGAKFCQECGTNLVRGVCPDCGHKNRSDAQFCEECGATLVGGVCPDCGHKNRADAQFCEECGANFKGAVKKSELPKEKSKKPGLPLWLKIIYVAIGLITLVAVVLILLGSDKYVDEFRKKAVKCSTGMTSMGALAEKAESDDTLLLDNEWIAENNAALGVMEEHCTKFGWDNDVPKEYETVNDLLLQSRSEYSEFIRLYRLGLSEMDVEIATQAAVHLIKSDDIIIQVVEIFDDMGIDILE